jgi:hypothetical protein
MAEILSTFYSGLGTAPSPQNLGFGKTNVTRRQLSQGDCFPGAQGGQSQNSGGSSSGQV